MTANTIAIGILGNKGRMGQAIADAIPAAGARLAGGADTGDDIEALAQTSDVMVDFTAPIALKANLDAAIATGTPIVIGTTGLNDEHHTMINKASQHIAVLQAANTSLGVNLLAALVTQAAARLGEDWDIDILEMHHRHKVDAPSGTALLLGQAAATGREKNLSDISCIDRDGVRDTGSIGFATLRGGSVAGDHMVVFATDGERIELGHRAENRNIFARGAVKAAQWLVGKPAGRYSMTDVLDL